MGTPFVGGGRPQKQNYYLEGKVEEFLKEASKEFGDVASKVYHTNRQVDTAVDLFMNDFMDNVVRFPAHVDSVEVDVKSSHNITAAELGILLILKHYHYELPGVDLNVHRAPQVRFNDLNDWDKKDAVDRFYSRVWKKIKGGK